MILGNVAPQVARASQGSREVKTSQQATEQTALNTVDTVQRGHHDDSFKNLKANCAFVGAPVAGAAAVGYGAYKLSSLFTSNPVVNGVAAAAGAIGGGSVGLMFGWAAAWGIMGD